MNILQDLFLTFAKIGLFTFGGGYAMIVLIENQCVNNKKWLSSDEMLDITVIAESTPGPIAINAASYIGYKKAGFIGSLIATIGIILPSFLIIYVISLFFDNFLEIALIAKAFKGIKVAVSVLIFNAGINMIKKMKKSKLSIFILLSSVLLMLIINIFNLNFSSLLLLVMAGLLSLLAKIKPKEHDYDLS